MTTAAPEVLRGRVVTPDRVIDDGAIGTPRLMIESSIGGGWLSSALIKSALRSASGSSCRDFITA